MAETRLPLERFKVLDLTRIRAGPTAVRQLADWGADVIKIEMPPEAGQADFLSSARHGFDFQNLQRNKRAMTLNLKAEEGVQILKDMVRTADVLVENYRPDVKNRLGIDYETMAAINPRLVYASVSGFGQDGPYADRPGFDQVAQGMGGLMSITGAAGDGPMRVGIPIADLTAGIFCAMGILVALLERQESGKGQWVTSSLLEAQVSMLDFQGARWLQRGEVPGQAGNNHPTTTPTGVYRTADGYMNIAASGGHIYERMCRAMGAEELLENADFDTDAKRTARRAEYNALLETYSIRKTSAEWIQILNDAGVPSGPINNIQEVFEDEQVRHLEMAQPVEHAELGTVHVVDQGVNLSRTPSKMQRAAPELGEHTEEILSEYGVSAKDIDRLRREKVI